MNEIEKNNVQRWKKKETKKKKVSKKQKRSPSIQTINRSNEPPDSCTSYRIASNRSKIKTQENP